MALQARPSKHSKFVIDAMTAMGFRQISGRPYEFIGNVAAQHNDYGMASIITLIPLKLQQGTYVMSLDMNGEQMVKTRLVTLEDLAQVVGYSGVVKEVLSVVSRKENDDSDSN
jgi:hypothetical protein